MTIALLSAAVSSVSLHLVACDPMIADIGLDFSEGRASYAHFKLFINEHNTRTVGSKRIDELTLEEWCLKVDISVEGDFRDTVPKFLIPNTQKHPSGNLVACSLANQS